MTEDQKKELKELQEVASRLGAYRKQLFDWKADYARAITIVNGLMSSVGKRINDIKSGQGEIVTDHAIVRYLERYKGEDLDKIKQKIKTLPDVDKVVINDVVITVGSKVGETVDPLRLKPPDYL